MKTFIRLFQVVAVAYMLTGCESCNGVDPVDPKSKIVTIQINSEFMTSFTTDIIDKGSNTDLNGPVCQLEQFGSGTDAELGAFDIYLTCCWSLADGLHSCTEGFISDPEGNILNIMCKDGEDGVVFTADFPLDQTYLGSEFEFTGGTGRFEGASGRGVMKCDVKNATNSMVHHWEADLTLITK
ncbi:MAG: hypothetical protein IH592_15515 [Bacteroidales bacterium]|nr:hypothetical protein [Bacteroidales bacterium]